tara:strand:+ start:1819 stop:2049 length:231 start_codon:yes stop_codon:yes gene_type:complete
MGPTKKTLGRSHAKNSPLKHVRADSRFQKKLGRAYAASRRPAKKKKTSPKARLEKKHSPAAGWAMQNGLLRGWVNG